MPERYPVIIFSSSSRVFNMVSGQIFNFYMDDSLSEVEVYIDSNKVTIKRETVSSIRISGNISTVIDNNNDIHDDTFGSLRYQVVFEGNRDSFYVYDNLWSYGKYEIEPSAPVLESELPPEWNFIKP